MTESEYLELSFILRKHRKSCMCGHFESCEYCDTQSAFNKCVKDIRAFIESMSIDINPERLPPSGGANQGSV